MTNYKQGFALPTVLISSIVMLMLLLSGLVSSSSISSGLRQQYTQKMQNTAADAAVVMAKQCIANNQVLWSDTNPLRPNTTCNGGNECSNDNTCFVLRASEGTYSTSFYVKAPTVQTNNGINTYDFNVVSVYKSYRKSNSSVSETRNLSLNVKITTKIAPVLGGMSASSCVIASDVKAYCWGANGGGALGNGSTANSSTPVAVNTSGVLNGKNINAASIGTQGCAIASDSKAYCWGQNSNGELGNGTTTGSTVPVAVNTSGVLNNKTLTSIDAGGGSACTLTTESKVYCWGSSAYGELGNGTMTSSSVPVAINSTKTIKFLARAYATHCVIDSDNIAYCWGYNAYGGIGNGTTTNSSVPVAINTSGVLSGLSINTIDSNIYHTCAIASNKKVYCWGYNGSGELGNGTTTNSSVPVAVDMSGALNGKSIATVSTGIGHTCVTTTDYEAYCWGSNNAGQLGTGNKVNSSVPVKFQATGALSGKNIYYVRSASASSCAIASNLKVYCLGTNTYGQLGNGTTTDSVVPVEVLNVSLYPVVLSTDINQISY